jgi:ubiquinone/menaquinone biosynthesis C-methylase UbiE
MLEIAAERLPDARLVRGDAVPLPFADRVLHGGRWFVAVAA